MGPRAIVLCESLIILPFGYTNGSRTNTPGQIPGQIPPDKYPRTNTPGHIPTTKKKVIKYRKNKVH